MNIGLFNRIAAKSGRDDPTGGIVVSNGIAREVPRGSIFNPPTDRPFSVKQSDLDQLVKSGLVEVADLGDGRKRYSLSPKGQDAVDRREMQKRADANVGILREDSWYDAPFTEPHDGMRAPSGQTVDSTLRDVVK